MYGVRSRFRSFRSEVNESSRVATSCVTLVGVASGVSWVPDVLQVDQEGCLRRFGSVDSVSRRVRSSGGEGHWRASRGVWRCSIVSGSGEESSPEQPEDEGGRGKSMMFEWRARESFDVLARLSTLTETERLGCKWSGMSSFRLTLERWPCSAAKVADRARSR